MDDRCQWLEYIEVVSILSSLYGILDGYVDPMNNPIERYTIYDVDMDDRVERSRRSRQSRL